MVYYLSQHLVNFLQSSAENRLLKSVLIDLKTPEYVAGCKALGLVSALITVPLWETIENESIHILDVGDRYQQVIDFILDAALSTSQFMEGTKQLPFAMQDPILVSLTKPSQVDVLTEAILKMMPPAMATCLKTIFADHIEGGR